MNSSRKGKLNGLLIVGNKIQMLFFGFYGVLVVDGGL